MSASWGSTDATEGPLRRRMRAGEGAFLQKYLNSSQNDQLESVPASKSDHSVLMWATDPSANNNSALNVVAWGHPGQRSWRF